MAQALTFEYPKPIHAAFPNIKGWAPESNKIRSGLYTWFVGLTNRKIPFWLSNIHTPSVSLSQSMVGQVGNVSILVAAAYQGLSTLDIMGCSTATSPATGCPTSTPSHTSTLITATLPCSHNVVASQNTRAKSTPDAIKSLAKNDGDPNTKVIIRDIALDDTFVSTTRDVDVAGPTVDLIGGVGTMEGVLTTSDNKNDWGSLPYLPASPLCGSSTVAPRGFEA
jgi:hypothetical protein